MLTSMFWSVLFHWPAFWWTVGIAVVLAGAVTAAFVLVPSLLSGIFARLVGTELGRAAIGFVAALALCVCAYWSGFGHGVSAADGRWEARVAQATEWRKKVEAAKATAIEDNLAEAVGKARANQAELDREFKGIVDAPFAPDAGSLPVPGSVPAVPVPDGGGAPVEPRTVVRDRVVVRRVQVPVDCPRGDGSVLPRGDVERLRGLREHAGAGHR